MFHGLVIATLLIGVAPAMGCSPTLQTEVTVDHPPPTIRSTYDLKEIQALAVSSGQPLRHEAYGFYISVFGYNISAGYKAGGTSGCEAVDAKVDLVLANRTIEIANDLKDHGCRPDTVIAHYLLHALNDDEIFTIYASRIAQALRSRFDGYSFDDPEGGDVLQVAGSAVKDVVGSVLQSFEQARETAAASADSDQELERLAGACIRSL
jgi:hypothetical protein